MLGKKLTLKLEKLFRVAGLKLNNYFDGDRVNWHKLVDAVVLNKRLKNYDAYIELFILGQRLFRNEFYDAINSRRPYNLLHSNPLGYAVNKNRPKLVEFLARFTDLEILENNPRQKPLHNASRRGFLDCIKILLNAGMNVDSRTGYEETPLHSAVEKGHIDCIIELLKRGANIEAKNKEGHTPLHKAARSFQIEAVRVLLDKGAKKNSKNIHGQTVLERIKSAVTGLPENEEKRLKIIEILENSK